MAADRQLPACLCCAQARLVGLAMWPACAAVCFELPQSVCFKPASRSSGLSCRAAHQHCGCMYSKLALYAAPSARPCPSLHALHPLLALALALLDVLPCLFITPGPCLPPTQAGHRHCRCASQGGRPSDGGVRACSGPALSPGAAPPAGVSPPRHQARWARLPRLPVGVQPTNAASRSGPLTVLGFAAGFLLAAAGLLLATCSRGRG